MRRLVIFIFCLTFWLLAACGSGTSSGIEKQAVDSGIPDVQALYEQRCATCHGLQGNMAMGGARKLTESALPKEEVLAQIRYGKGAMPPFREMLSEEEMTALADYVFTFRPTSKP